MRKYLTWFGAAAIAVTLLGTGALHTSAQMIPSWPTSMGAGISAPVFPLPRTPMSPLFATSTGDEQDGETADDSENSSRDEAIDGINCPQEGTYDGENVGC